jgi:predicted RNase H-related nuclease YkuK (DUF458 family)
MIEDKKIRDLSGNLYSKEELLSKLKEYDKQGYDFYIGTDSQVFAEHVSVVTAICPRITNNGLNRCGRVFHFKEKLDPENFKTLRMRMLFEAYRSIEVAMDIESHIKNKIAIHLDIGDSNRSDTRIFKSELLYLVTSQGYECKIKPDSWAATGPADKFSKS